MANELHISPAQQDPRQIGTWSAFLDHDQGRATEEGEVIINKRSNVSATVSPASRIESPAGAICSAPPALLLHDNLSQSHPPPSAVVMMRSR